MGTSEGLGKREVATFGDREWSVFMREAPGLPALVGEHQGVLASVVTDHGALE